MSRTDLDPATIARAARRMAGDGSIEWVMEPIQASVLLDVADMLDENAKLRELCADMYEWMGRAMYDGSARKYEYELIVSRMHDLGIEAD